MANYKKKKSIVDKCNPSQPKCVHTQNVISQNLPLPILSLRKIKLKSKTRYRCNKKLQIRTRTTLHATRETHAHTHPPSPNQRKDKSLTHTQIPTYTFYCFVRHKKISKLLDSKKNECVRKIKTKKETFVKSRAKNE